MDDRLKTVVFDLDEFSLISLRGILAGTLRFVPYLGAMLSIVLILVFTVAVSPTWMMPLLVVALLVILELSTTNIIEPLLLGTAPAWPPLHSWWPRLSGRGYGDRLDSSCPCP